MQDLQECDELHQELRLPSDIACCDDEEALLVQSKLDFIIAELREIKAILQKHKASCEVSQLQSVQCKDEVRLDGLIFSLQI